MLALSLATGILFGLSPALQLTRADLNASLKDEGSSFGRRLSRSRLRSVFIGAQVAVSVMLIISAGFLMRGLLRSRNAEPGFDTLGIPVLRGRGFTRTDIESHAPVAVISESAARHFWPGIEPLGRRFTLDMDFKGTLADFEVIGIVKDVRYGNLTRVDPAHVYLPVRDGQANNGILLRLDGDPTRALAAIRAAVEAVGQKAAPVLALTSLEDGPVRAQRMMSAASATFASILAGLALALAAVGIYGVMAYLVGQRVRETGIRMALGASPAAVVRSMVAQGLRPVFVGMAVGFLLAAGISGLLHASLGLPASVDPFYGVPFYDPATFVGLTCFVAVVAAAASAIPARRATRVDPIAALRHD